MAGDHRVTASSIAVLPGELSRALYNALHAGKRPDAGTRPEPDAALERRLTGAVPHTTTRVPVRLVAVASGGALVAELDGVRVRIPDNALAPAAGQTFGHLVLVEAGCVRPRLSPGHLLVDGSRGNGLACGPVLRVYVHLTDADAAVASWWWTLRCLERLRVPYRAKILSAGSTMPRRDALVVYLGPDAWHAASAIGAGLSDHSGRGREVSPFTHPLALGVSVAWEPEDDRIGQRGLSFGLHRSLAVATGLVDHATGAVPADRDGAVSGALIDAGIDPARPFRNTNSPPLPTT